MKASAEPRKHDQKPAGYRSYLLRIWSTGEAESWCWRASIEDPRTGERIGFANLEELFAFLMERAKVDANREISE